MICSSCGTRATQGEGGQVRLGRGVALGHRVGEPDGALRRIGRPALAEHRHHAQAVLCRRVSALGGTQKPAARGAKVHIGATAELVAQA